MAALRELLVRFGVDVDSERLEHFTEELTEVGEKLKEFGEIMLGSLIGEKLHEFVESQIEAGAQLAIMSERLGVTTDDLQRFQLAGQLAGMSAEDAATGLRFLNRNLGEVAEGNKEAIATFQKLHVDTKDLTDESTPLSEKIGQIADGFAELKTHGEKTAYAMKLFGKGGSALIPVLSEGREKIEELFGSFDELGGGLDKNFVQKSHEAEHATVKLKFALGGLKSRIAAELIPGFQRTTEWVTKWVLKIINLSKTTYVLQTAIASLKLAAFVGIFSKIVQVMRAADGGVGGFIRSLLKMGPIILLGLALYLIFDDLFTLMQGGDSIIGKLLDEMFGVGTATNLVDALYNAWDALVEFWSGPGKSGVQEFLRVAIAGLIVGVDTLITSIRALAEWLQFAWDVISFNSLSKAEGHLDNIKKRFDEMTNRAQKVGSWGFGSEKAGAAAKPTLPTEANTIKATDLGDVDNPAFANRRGHTVNVDITNNISGVSDPKAAAEHAGRATKQAVTGASMRSAFGAQPTGA